MFLGLQFFGLFTFSFYSVLSSDIGNTSVSETSLNESNNEDNTPIVKLIDAKFHTNDSVKEDKVGCEYNLPITFQTLKFSCTSKYPTVWKFQIPPHDDKRLKDFTVTKIRKIKSYENFWDRSVYTYESNLTLNFKDPKSVPTIFCSRSKSYNLSATIDSLSSSDNFRIIVRIHYSVNGIKEYEDKRFGRNKYCNVTLEINTENDTFLCGNDSRPQFIQCSNPDECNSNFILDDSTIGSCNNTFINNSTTACTDKKCVQFSPSFSPAVIICQDNFGNSIARRYVVYRTPSGLSRMRLGRETVFDLQETIHLKLLKYNESQIYFGQNVSFVCSGVGSYYSNGFVWGLQASGNSSIMFMKSDSENFNLTSNNYITSKTIFFSNATKESNFTVFCFGPRWNRVDWVNNSEVFQVKTPEKPTLHEYLETASNHTTSELYHYSFTCVIYGQPAPKITWIWNNRVLDLPMVEKHYTISHHSSEGSVTSTSSTLKAQFLRSQKHNFTCIGSNFIGNVQHAFCLETEGSVTIIVGVALLVLLLVLATASVFLTRHYYRKKLQLLSDEEIDEFENGNCKADNYALLLPYSMENEIPQQDVTILEHIVLGEGQFGVVYKGKHKSRIVAIKTVKKTADVRYFKALLAEIKIMCYVGHHENLVNALGASTRNIRTREIYLISEFCENGDLLTFLKSSRGVCLDLFHSQKSAKDCQNNLKLINIRNNSVNVMPCMTTLNLLHWSFDIACGMEYLSSKKVVHGDLAARNVLLTNSFVAKVGDFGLSKLLEDYGIYVQKMECPLPLKWLAIESLQDFEFSVMSDVWSYGITLWEIFSMGATPYPGIPNWNFQSHTLLKTGYRMDSPTFSNDNIYNMMRGCWNESPNTRPTFTQLKQFFQNQFSSC